MAIKNTTLRIDEDLIYKVKQIALDERKTQTEVIKEFIVEGIARREKK